METKTSYNLGDITYLIESRSNEKACDTLHKKLEKLLLRDVRHDAEQADLSQDSTGHNGEIAET